VKSNRCLWPFILPLVLRVFNPPTLTEIDSKFTSDIQGMVQTVVDSLMSAARKFSCLNSSIKNLSPCEYWQVNSNLLILIMTFYSHNNTIQAQKGRRDSAVVIVTMLRAGYLSNLGSICASSKRFFSSPKRASRPAVPPLKLPTTWSQGMFIPGQVCRCVKMTTHLHLVPGLRKTTAISSLPIRLYAVHRVRFCLDP
jgi:hypothetical protein